jgi:hypothetical protein
MDTPQGERDFVGVWSKISQTPKNEGRKMWLCRGFPQCTDVSQAKGNFSVRYEQQQAMKAVVDVVRSQQHKLAK